MRYFYAVFFILIFYNCQSIPIVPNKISLVEFELQDILHTFKQGHRIMIQVQSSWFPLVDINPQNYVDNIYKAERKDFVTALHKVYSSKDTPSSIEYNILLE